METIKLWEVSGSFLIPGSREKGEFGPIKVIAMTRQQASKNLVSLLNNKFRKELHQANQRAVGRPFEFGNDFALMNLRWVEKFRAAPKVKVEPEVIHAIR